MEVTHKGKSGFGYLSLILVLMLLALGGIIFIKLPILSIVLIIGSFLLAGLIIVNPNESRVLILFGKYVGTIKDNGFFWVNPFYVKKAISLKARNFDTEHIKVNDSVGNPIVIGAVLVWRVQDTYKAAFEVDNYIEFVRVQSDAAIRKLAGLYPYDNFNDHDVEITLRAGGEEVNHVLEHELSERLKIAGIQVIEARISHLAYASEIAGAMLQRQQAIAVVAARSKIVEGAVGMVEQALNDLSKKGIIELDDERKANMVSNLMVVLCSDKAAQPVLNAGTLY